MAERNLTVRILGDASSLQRAFGKSEESARGFNGVLGRLSIGFGSLVKGTIIIEGVTKALEGLNETVHAGIDEFRENVAIQAQTTAALKSTGNIAGVTSDEIRKLSLELSNLSGISDESIRSAENVELAFTNIRNSAGKGNDIFTRATKAIVDFSARTGKDAPAAALLLGKALEDPARRIGILARAGIVFTGAQQKQIKVIEQSKGILAAQKIVLDELTKRYGGAAKAAGETLPGALSILKERFKDLAGEGIALVNKPLTTATIALKNFVVALSEAKSFHAKLDVAVQGIEDLSRSIFDSVKHAIESVDWRTLSREVGTQIRGLFDQARAYVSQIDFRGIGDEVERRLAAIDWRQKISTAGRDVGRALVYALNQATAFLKQVDWTKVGRVIADGIAVAIGAVAKFLASVDWSKVSQAVRRFLIAAFRADRDLFVGVGEVVGKLLYQGIAKGLSAVGKALEKLGLELALTIVEPFSHIPKLLGGGTFQAIKTELQNQLDALKASAAQNGQQIGAALSDGIVQGFSAKASNLAASESTLIAGTAAASVATPTPTTATLLPPAADLLGHPAKRKGITADQRNTFFDNMISRLLDQSQDGSIQTQIAKLKAIGDLITKRIAATKDVTRKLTLEAELLDDVTRPLKDLRSQEAQNLLDALQLGVDRAAATKSVADDISALQALQAGIKKRIAAVGRTHDLEEQLLGVEGQLMSARQTQAQNRATARNAKQFLALGLTSTGDDRVPGVSALRSSLGSFTQAVSGTFLDTSKTRSVLSHIRKVLSGGLGDIGRDVRDKIKGILDDLKNQLDNAGGEQTKFKHTTINGLLAGAGLDERTVKIVKQRLASLGAGGTVPGGRSAAFAGAGGVTYTGPVTQHFYGVNDPKKMQSELNKSARNRPNPRRGT